MSRYVLGLFEFMNSIKEYKMKITYKQISIKLLPRDI